MPVDITLCKVTSDVVQGNGLELRYNPLGAPELISFRRAVTVRNLTAACYGEASKAVAVGLQAIQAKYPVASADADFPAGRYRGYSVLEVLDSDAILYGVEVRFDSVPWPTTEWIYQSFGQENVVETDVQYGDNDTDGNPTKPISADNYLRRWEKPEDDKPKHEADPDDSDGAPAGSMVPDLPEPPDFGVVQISKGLRGLRYTRRVASTSQAVAFDKAALLYEQHLNATVFTGLTTGPAAQNFTMAPGTVRCLTMNVNYSPYEAYYLCEASFLYDPAGHQPYFAWKSRITREIPGNCFRSPQGDNGIVRTSAYPKMDLNQVFGLLTS